MPDEFRRRADEDVRERMNRVEDRQIAMAQTLVRIEDNLTRMNGDLMGIKAEVGGAPELSLRGERKTLRFRVHTLENDKAAAAIASALRSRTWSTWEKTLLFGFAALAAVTSILRLAGVGG